MKDAPAYRPFTIPTASDSLARPKEIVPIYEGDLGAQGPAPGFSMPPPLPFRQEQESAFRGILQPSEGYAARLSPFDLSFASLGIPRSFTDLTAARY